MRGAICIVCLATFGCAAVPEKQIATAPLPPTQVLVPVRCVKEIPEPPTTTIDPNGTVLQRYYQMKELLAAYDEYRILASAVIAGCAAETK